MWSTFVDWGQYGVDVFFVISGYTVFYQIFHAKYDLKYFLMQRIARISAPYWPLLLLLFLTGVMGISLGSNYWGYGAYGLEVPWQNWLLHALYLNFWNVAYSNTIIGVEWTLAIEVFYYICLGLILTSAWFKKSIKKALILLCLVLLSFASIGIYIMHAHIIDEPLNIHWSPMLYGYMFVFGGIAFFIRKAISVFYTQVIKNRVSDFSFILMVGLYWLNLSFQYFPYTPLFFACITTVIIVFMQDSSFFGKLLTLRPVLFLGSISYSFYLWHILILHAGFLQVSWSSSALNFFYLLFLSIAVAFCWYYVFEKKVYGRIKVMIKRYQ